MSIYYYKEWAKKNRLSKTLKYSKSKTWIYKKLILHQRVYLIRQTGWWSFSFLSPIFGFKVFQSFRPPFFLDSPFSLLYAEKHKTQHNSTIKEKDMSKWKGSKNNLKNINLKNGTMAKEKLLPQKKKYHGCFQCSIFFYFLGHLHTTVSHKQNF